ncbi:YjzC family protein [Hyalangium versicolor]|uniref:YjzC family protein n=1 Tax=Hyalangium versicolor TaxID=2861190 RepID=UPI001CCE86FD|nr:YjzC family protein [Hyalangium versicolor]
MAALGQEFKTGAKCETKGIYTFDRYVDDPQTPLPTDNERNIPLDEGDTFPPIKSQGRAAWWRLTRLT